MTAQQDPSIPESPILGDLVPEAALAERWGVARRTLQRRRRAGAVPPFLKLGRRVFYRLRDIEAFEAAMTVCPGDEA